MTAKQEYEKLKEMGFNPIKPFKLAEMSKMASKIVKMLTSNKSFVMFGYEDMKIILEIVAFTLDEGTGQTEKERFL